MLAGSILVLVHNPPTTTAEKIVKKEFHHHPFPQFPTTFTECGRRKTIEIVYYDSCTCVTTSYHSCS